MGRPKGSKNKGQARTNTIGTNGNRDESKATGPVLVMSAGEAIRKALDALGDVQVEDTLAPHQMRELGGLYEDVAKETASYNLKAEAAKIAKKALDVAVLALLNRVKDFTHPSPMPLFDAPQAEADQAAMEAGPSLVEQIGSGAPAPDPTDASAAF